MNTDARLLQRVIETLLVALLASAPLSLRASAQTPAAPDGEKPSSSAQGEAPGDSAVAPDPAIMSSSSWRIHGLIHPAHRQGINQVAFSPDGKTIASVGDDKKLNLWDVESQRLLESIERPVNCTSLAFSPDGSLLAIAGGDSGAGQPPGEVVLWDLAAGKVRFEFERHGRSKYVKTVCFSPDGKWLASAGVDARVRLWDVAAGRLYRTLSGHKALVSQVAFSPDGRMLASASFDTTIKLWTVPMGVEAAALQGHEKEVRGVAFAPDGRRIVSVSDDKTARVWDVASREQIGVLEDAHPGAVFSVAFAPDSRHVVTGSTQGSMGVIVWDVETQNWGDPDVFPRQSWHATSLAFSPDGRMLAIVGGWNSFQIWKRWGGEAERERDR